MKTPFHKRMSQAYDACPGAVLAQMPATEFSEGSIVVDPVCSRDALAFLKRRFIVEEAIGIETTGELKFRITPRQRRAPGKPVRHVQKPIQYELPLT